MTKTLSSIREQVSAHKGEAVRCRIAKGRNRFEETEGVLLDVYPNLFTLYDRAKSSTVSFSFAELLTHEVELDFLG